MGTPRACKGSFVSIVLHETQSQAVNSQAEPSLLPGNFSWGGGKKPYIHARKYVYPVPWKMPQLGRDNMHRRR